jgi:hypothetical protein
MAGEQIAIQRPEPIFDLAPYMMEAEDRDKKLDEALGPELVALHDATTRYYAWVDFMGKWHEEDTISPYFSFHTDDLFGIVAGNPIMQLLFGFGFGRHFSYRSNHKARRIIADAYRYSDEVAKIYKTISDKDDACLEKMAANMAAKENYSKEGKNAWKDAVDDLKEEYMEELGELKDMVRGMSNNGGGATYGHAPDGAIDVKGLEDAYIKRLENVERVAGTAARLVNNLYADKRAKEDRPAN